MNIIIKTKNIELSSSLDSYIQKRLEGLKKFSTVFKNLDPDLVIEIQKESNHHNKGDVFVAEAIIALSGKTIMAKAHGDDMGKAITDMRDELEREIKKYKTKMIEVPRRKYRKDLQKELDNQL